MVVTWSPRSKDELNEIADYLYVKWGARTTLRFLDQLDRTIESLQNRINASRLFEKERNIRKIMVRKQVTVYYRQHSDEIEILSVFVNYRDPAKLRF